MQKSKEISERIRPHILIRIIEDSKIPLEEEPKLQKIKRKVEHDEQLSREDEVFLTRLVVRANEWQKGLKNSSDTEPRSEEHTSELQSRVDLVCRLLLEKKKRV